MEHKKTEKTKRITTQYPLDIFGATFYYDISDDNTIKVYHSAWKGISGTGKTLQKAIENMKTNARELYKSVFSKYQSNYVHKDFLLISWLQKLEKFYRSEDDKPIKRGCFS